MLLRAGHWSASEGSTTFFPVTSSGLMAYTIVARNLGKEPISRPHESGGAYFVMKRVKKCGRLIVARDDSDLPKQDYRAIRDRRISLDISIREYLARLVDFEADAAAMPHICREVTRLAGGVKVY